MSFRLLIECSKDIDTLHIDFTDGTSVVQHVDDNDNNYQQDKPKRRKTNTKHTKGKEQPTNSRRSESDENVQSKSKPRDPRDQLLDLDTDYSEVSQEIVELPEIKSEHKDVKVAQEMQNLDF